MVLSSLPLASMFKSGVLQHLSAPAIKSDRQQVQHAQGLHVKIC